MCAGGTKPARSSPCACSVAPHLAVLHVGLAPGQVARLAAVDHQHFQASGLQHAVQRQPVHASGLHRHRTHLACEQPVAQRIQLRGNGAEHFGRAAGNRDVHLFAADIDERGAWVKHSQVTHDEPPSRIATMATTRRRPGRAQCMTNLSNGKNISPKCATVRDRNQSTYRALTRTRGLSGHAARDKMSPTQAYPVHGPCAVSTETGGYIGSILGPISVIFSSEESHRYRYIAGASATTLP